MIFFLYGQDTYRSRQKLRELKEKFVRDVDPSGANLVVLDGATMKPEDFRNAVSAMSMFVKKRMVVVERLLESGKKPVQEAVAEYLAHKDFPEDHIVVFWEGEITKARNHKSMKSKKPVKKKSASSADSAIQSLRDVLLRQKYVQEFALLEYKDVERWITEDVERRGGNITAGAARLLASAVGNDLWRLSNEIGKLYAGNTHITEEAIHESIIAKTESAIFAFTDALGARRRDEALRFLMRERAAGIEPLYLLGMMVRQFRILLRLSHNDTEGIHPFVIQKTRSQLAHFSVQELKNIYQRLLEIDVLLKTSRVDPDALFTLFIHEVSSQAVTSSVPQYSS